MSISVAQQELLDAIDSLQFAPDPAPRRTPVAGSAEWTLPGFLGRTRIRTAFGEVPAEALCVNDPVMTTSGRVVQVRRIDRVILDHDYLHRHPEAQPVRIMAHAFGPNVPDHDLIVSPGQELAVATQAALPRGIRAGKIKGNASVIAAVYGRLIYYVLDLGEPVSIFAEGLQVVVPERPAAARDEEDEDDIAETAVARPARHAAGEVPKEGSAARRSVATSLARLTGWSRSRAVGQK